MSTRSTCTCRHYSIYAVCYSIFKCLYFTCSHVQLIHFDCNISKSSQHSGSSAMYIGLTLTSSSTFQMLRGSVIIFVALFSIIFLGRRLLSREWYGIVMLFVGLLTVGFSDYWEKKHNSSAEKSVDDNSMQQMIMGDVIIVLAQIIVALQMVYQEKFVARFNIPALQAVGWEGFFGFLTTLILLWPLNYAYIPWENNQKLSDVPLAVKQIKGDWRILALIFASIFSISIFNFTGLSVTKEISATTRMVLDSLRTVLIWAFEMCMGWKGFQSLQLIGFIFLLFGTCLYNNMFVPEFCRDRPSPPLRRKMDAIHQPTIVGATIVSATRIDDD